MTGTVFERFGRLGQREAWSHGWEFLNMYRVGSRSAGNDVSWHIAYRRLLLFAPERASRLRPCLSLTLLISL